MWIATEHGFYSAVENTKNRDTVLVRARVRADLQAMIDQMGWRGVTITDSPRADYPHRVVLKKKMWAHFVSQAAAGVDYPNFKSRVAQHDVERAHVYHDVWADLQQLEPGMKRRTARRRSNGNQMGLDFDWDADERDALDEWLARHDEIHSCPDCAEPVYGRPERCNWCACEFDWDPQEEHFDEGDLA